MPLGEQTVVRACPCSEGNPSQIPLLLMGLEMEHEWVCVAVVMGCPAGYGGRWIPGTRFLRVRVIQRAKVKRPGHARTHEQESELKSCSKDGILW